MSKYEKASPSAEIIIGIAAIIASGFMYVKFQELETSGGTFKINIIFYFLYKTLGKEIASAVFLFLGLFFVGNGIQRLNNKKRWKEFEKENNKPKFISVNEEQFQVKRKLTPIETDYLNDIDLDIQEGQVYKHFWTENINKDENDQNWLNIAKYFWKADEPFYNTSLPEAFSNYQQLNFRFLKNDSTIKTEKLTETVERYHCEASGEIIFITDLAEQNSLQYCNIEDIEEDTIGDLKYFEEDLFLLITNPKIKLQNNELFIGEEKISFAIAYSIGALELLKRTKSEVSNDFADENLLIS